MHELTRSANDLLATYEESEWLGLSDRSTRSRAYRWVEEHMRYILPDTVVYLGGVGINSYFCEVRSQLAKKVIVLDRYGKDERHENRHKLSYDMEAGLPEISDCSIDAVTSISAIEHL